MDTSFQNEVLNIDGQVKIEEEALNWKKVSPHYLKVLLIRALIYALLFLVFLYLYHTELLNMSDYMNVYLMYGSYTLVVIYLFLRAFVEYKRRRYVVRSHDIIHRKGFLSIQTIVMPYVRVQQVKIVEGIWSRLWSLASIQISSASSNGSDVMIIAGVKKEIAEEIRKIIIQNIKERDEAKV